MKYSKRRYFTQADKNLMWDRWQKGESLNSIARRDFTRGSRRSFASYDCKDAWQSAFNDQPRGQA